MKKRKSTGTDRIGENKIKFAEKYLGMRGRWMRTRKPATIQHAFIVDSQNENVWYGDLDADLDREILITLSEKMGTLYILRESRYLVSRERPAITTAINEALVTVDKGDIKYSELFGRYVDAMKDKERQMTAKKESK